MPELIISFKRTEKKYLMSASEYRSLIGRIGKYLIPDEYGKSTICSAYLDTPDYRIVRSSIEAGNYKEKLRLRSYSVPNSESRVFLEIKKIRRRGLQAPRGNDAVGSDRVHQDRT